MKTFDTSTFLKKGDLLNNLQHSIKNDTYLKKNKLLSIMYNILFSKSRKIF